MVKISKNLKIVYTITEEGKREVRGQQQPAHEGRKGE
jgi:hypothetical protein